MFFPEGQIRVHLYGAPVDMRKSYTGLYAMTREGLRQNPLSGDLFVFVSRKATQMKVLYFDRSGFCIWGKKLEAGRFISDWRAVRTQQMDWTALKLLLEGIEPGRRRKRFHRVMAQKAEHPQSHSLQCVDAESGGSRAGQKSSEPG
ncbi:MAG TPA: IS66 family insertion sequence element accessory protein TnpB [Candidatus Paceibacterota bacterium]|nr:IS66 family insertion sequence element accessory protein TnpB [Candidatus Paceibacterota bacterium]